MMFFIADTHFGHENIIKACNRPFSSIEQMNETLISNWNSRVSPGDTVYVIGDMFFRCNNAEAILMRLKGKKRLILGNHDGSWIDTVDLTNYFLSVDRLLEVSDGERMMTLCHYPMMTWKHHTKSYMIHGHIHGHDIDLPFWPLIKSNELILNAGVDVNGFCPVTFDELVVNNAAHKKR